MDRISFPSFALIFQEAVIVSDGQQLAVGVPGERPRARGGVVHPGRPPGLDVQDLHRPVVQGDRQRPPVPIPIHALDRGVHPVRLQQSEIGGEHPQGAVISADGEVLPGGAPVRRPQDGMPGRLARARAAVAGPAPGFPCRRLSAGSGGRAGGRGSRQRRMRWVASWHSPSKPPKMEQPRESRDCYLSFFSRLPSMSNSRFSPPKSASPFPLSSSPSIVRV